MNANRTLGLAMASAAIGTTGVQAAVVTTAIPPGVTEVALGEGSVKFTNPYFQGLAELNAVASVNVLVASVVSAGTIIDSNLTFQQVQTIDKAAGNTANLGTGLLLPFQVTPQTGSPEYGYMTFDATQAADNSFGFNLQAYSLDATGAAVVTPGGVSPIPEPSSLAMLAVGSLGLAAWRRRRHACRA